MSYLKASILMMLIFIAFAAGGWAIDAAFIETGWPVDGQLGAIVATLLALVFHLIVFWGAESIVLKLHNAREVGSDHDSPMIRAFVADCDKLAMKANMPRPRTYIIDAHQPNAFIAGRDSAHASIAVTDGLLNSLTRSEVTAVIAHELAHVKRGDAFAMGIISALAALAATILGALAWPLGQRKPVMRVVSGLVARLGRSHSREYAADRRAVEICGSPLSLANALLKLERQAASLVNPMAERNPSTAMMFVVDPLHGRRRGPSSTHPPTERRIERLHRMSREIHREEV
jgi:heat shock protein HtpX